MCVYLCTVYIVCIVICTFPTSIQIYYLVFTYVRIIYSASVVLCTHNNNNCISLTHTHRLLQSHIREDVSIEWNDSNVTGDQRKIHPRDRMETMCRDLRERGWDSEKRVYMLNQWVRYIYKGRLCVMNRTGIENKYENVCLTGAESLPSSHESRVITRPAIEHIYCTLTETSDDEPLALINCYPRHIRLTSNNAL